MTIHELVTILATRQDVLVKAISVLAGLAKILLQRAKSKQERVPVEQPVSLIVFEGGRKRAQGERIIVQQPIRLSVIEGGRKRARYHSRIPARRVEKVIEIPLPVIDIRPSKRRAG
jgi:hypothetical protein